MDEKVIVAVCSIHMPICSTKDYSTRLRFFWGRSNFSRFLTIVKPHTQHNRCEQDIQLVVSDPKACDNVIKPFLRKRRIYCTSYIPSVGTGNGLCCGQCSSPRQEALCFKYLMLTDWSCHQSRCSPPDTTQIAKSLIQRQSHAIPIPIMTGILRPVHATTGGLSFVINSSRS
jgi:hypothetical protein